MDDLSNTLHHFPPSHRDWDREWEYEKKEMARLENPFRPANLDPASYPFFEGQLHDGYVLGIEQAGDRLEVTVTYSLLEMFCNTYHDEIGEDWKPILSPVRLMFEGVNYINAVRTDPEGWLKWDDWTRWRSTDDLRCADTFLRGYFYEQAGKVQWVGHFHKWATGTRKDPYNFFLLVDCERVSAKPESERALRKRIGDHCYDAWMYIQALPRDETWFSTGHLRRYLESNGMPVWHIPHQSERQL